MKSIVLVFLALAIGHHVSASALPKEDMYRLRAHQLRADMNEYFDNLVAKLKVSFKEQGLDPLPLPDVKEAFNHTDLLGVVWHGELELTNGSLADLSSLSRSGDTSLSYEDKLVEVKAEIGFSDVILDYDFRAQIMNLGPKGTIEGKLDDLKISLDLLADLDTMKLSLKDLQISNAGKLDVAVKGLILDELIDVIADAVTLIFHNLLVEVIEKEVRKVVTNAVAEIDLGSIIGGGGTRY